MYTAIAASVLLWPSNTASAREFYYALEPSKTTFSQPAIKEALNQATDVYLAKNIDNKFSLPYTHINNKEEFWKVADLTKFKARGII
jgi:predicted DNA-binding protein